MLSKREGVSLSSRHQFHTKKPSVPHQKPLSSTPNTPQFHKPFSFTPKTPQFHTPPIEGRGRTEGFSALNCPILLLNWGILGAEKEWSLCGTDVLIWGGLCGTEEYSKRMDFKTRNILNFLRIKKLYNLINLFGSYTVFFVNNFRYNISLPSSKDRFLRSFAEKIDW